MSRHVGTYDLDTSQESDFTEKVQRNFRAM